MGESIPISVVALLVSIGSLVYAASSSDAAEFANQIALESLAHERSRDNASFEITDVRLGAMFPIAGNQPCLVQALVFIQNRGQSPSPITSVSLVVVNGTSTDQLRASAFPLDSPDFKLNASYQFRPVYSEVPRFSDDVSGLGVFLLELQPLVFAWGSWTHLLVQVESLRGPPSNIWVTDLSDVRSVYVDPNCQSPIGS